VNATPADSPTDDVDADDSAGFADLLAANRTYAQSHPLSGFDGVARAGVAMVTCMDSRIDPLGMIGLRPGDAKILRNPGGRVTDLALVALVLGVNLLGVRRILVVQHTRCAMATGTEEQLKARISAASGRDASSLALDVITNQVATLTADVRLAREHPLISPSIQIGGFLYDVDTGLLSTVA
jgi:carbonic anhydrase